MEDAPAETTVALACAFGEVHVDPKKEGVEPGISEEIVAGCHHSSFSFGPRSVAAGRGHSYLRETEQHHTSACG